jgi:hypothetical protein
VLSEEKVIVTPALAAPALAKDNEELPEAATVPGVVIEPPAALVNANAVIRFGF